MASPQALKIVTGIHNRAKTEGTVEQQHMKRKHDDTILKENSKISKPSVQNSITNESRYVYKFVCICFFFLICFSFFCIHRKSQ